MPRVGRIPNILPPHAGARSGVDPNGAEPSLPRILNPSDASFSTRQRVTRTRGSDFAGRALAFHVAIRPLPGELTRSDADVVKGPRRSLAWPGLARGEMAIASRAAELAKVACRVWPGTPPLRGLSRVPGVIRTGGAVGSCVSVGQEWCLSSVGPRPGPRQLVDGRAVA